MKGAVFLTLVLLAATVDRLPAPIVETPEEQQQQQPAKTRTKKTKTTESESSSKTKSPAKVGSTSTAPSGPARFAGTWSGKISQGLLGHVPTSVRIDSTATSIELDRNLGGGTRPLTASGNTVSWHSGVMGEVAWTLTPSGDGRTAQVTMKGMLLNDATTFHRGQ